jgi:hypothetical protein
VRSRQASYYRSTIDDDVSTICQINILIEIDGTFLHRGVVASGAADRFASPKAIKRRQRFLPTLKEHVAHW